MDKTFFDEGALALYNNLDNKRVIGLKYCLYEDFDGGFEEISIMLGNLGWDNICHVNEIVYMDLVKDFMQISKLIMGI